MFAGNQLFQWRDRMTAEKVTPASGTILVVGGGISGLTTAIETAEVGYEVFLIEKNPYLSGSRKGRRSFGQL
jgi:heterodisulfide reductase subunit A-like polyferredoxin